MTVRSGDRNSAVMTTSGGEDLRLSHVTAKVYAMRGGSHRPSTERCGHPKRRGRWLSGSPPADGMVCGVGGETTRMVSWATVLTGIDLRPVQATAVDADVLLFPSKVTVAPLVLARQRAARLLVQRG
jgi:hypothetical protein